MDKIIKTLRKLWKKYRYDEFAKDLYLSNNEDGWSTSDDVQLQLTKDGKLILSFNDHKFLSKKSKYSTCVPERKFELKVIKELDLKD